MACYIHYQLIVTRSKLLTYTPRLRINETRGIFIGQMELLGSHDLKSSFGDPDWVRCYNHNCNLESIPINLSVSTQFAWLFKIWISKCEINR